MAIVHFTHYLHDGYSSYELADSIKKQCPELADMDDDMLIELIGRPFYEVTLQCELDTETGEVTLLETSF